MGVYGNYIDEPEGLSVEELRTWRRDRCALGYRVLAAHRWGELGDGHVTARDPERTDHFWLLRYDVPFPEASGDDMVLVAPDGRPVEGGDIPINHAAYFIHSPVFAARPDVVSAVHTHTPYGTPWSAFVQPLRMVSQESTCFIDRQQVWDNEMVDVLDMESGKDLANTLADGRLLILRNHGALTVGGSVDEAVGWFILAERSAEANVKSYVGGHPISDDAARVAADNSMANIEYALQVFAWTERRL
ncbi:MAG: class II aldolase/adducin family protein [Acidimicrobiales bacterium]